MGFKQLIKDSLPHGLLGRSLLIIVMPLILLQIVSAYIFYGNHWETVAWRLSTALAGEIGMLVETMSEVPDAALHEHLFNTAFAKLELQIAYDEGGILPNIRSRSPSGFLETSLDAALRERVRRPFLIDADSAPRDVLIKIQLPDGLLTVETPKKRLFTSTTYIFVLWMVGTSLLLFGVATIFMRNQVRSVRRLAAAADSFGKGREVPFFKPEGAAEVRQAASAFTLMQERIRRQIDQRTEMLAGVSHDLRTPITRMKLQLAMMEEADGSAELGEDLTDMERMIEGYLAFARGEGSERLQPCDVSDLVEDMVARFRREGAAIDYHSEGRFTLPLRPHAMERAVMNLIGNACRYADHIGIRVGHRQDAIEVVIDDDGPGIPADKREEVFRAFTRLENSRNPKTGGVGLGLTIARDVVRSHGGDVVLEDSPLGGLRARVRLPL